MSKFSYSYRSSSGAIEKARIEADSRTDALAQLRAKGITPIALHEGDDTATRKSKRFPRSAKIALVSVVVLCGAAMLALIFAPAPKSKPSEDNSRRRRIETVKHGKMPVTNSVTSTGEAITETSSLPSTIEVPTTSPTNGHSTTGNVRAARSSGMGRRVVLMDGTETNITQRPIFKRDFERALMAASKPGGLTMNLTQIRQKYSDAEFKKMLMEPVTINDDDSENEINIKLRVQQSKEELIEFLNGGGTVDEAIALMQKQSREENAERTASFRMLKELIAEGDGEEVRRFVAERNKDHEKLGLPLLQVPGKFRLESVNHESESEGE